MIRYLNQEEKADSRLLWEEIFREDSSSFLDFYYSERVKHNQILVQEEDGRVVAMLHRNPYDMVVRDRVWKADYIAAVSTKKAWRRQGIMGSLLIRSLADMYADQMEFCFLLPVNPDTYEPFGFTYIYNHTPVKPKESQTEHLLSRSCTEASGEYENAAFFASRELARSYQVYCLRTEHYYRNLAKEVRSDGGDLLLLKGLDGDLKGICAYYGNGEDAMREFLCIPELPMTREEPKPRMMARIICLERFIQVIRLKKDCDKESLDLIIQITDRQVCQNNGLFLWTLTQQGSVLQPVGENKTVSPQITVGIEEMTSWLFGYSLLSVEEEQKYLIDSIEPLKGVYLEEIV